MEAFTLVLMAEAAFAFALAKRKGERLAEAVSFLIVSVLLLVVDVVELASRISGAPRQLLSVESARSLGVELIRSAEEILSAAVKWSYYLSLVNSIALAAITILLVVKGIVIAAFLVQSGINALQSLANAYLIVSAVYLFVGQLFVVLADAAVKLRSLLPLAGLLMIPKVTRRLGASLLTLVVFASLVMPALSNLLAFSLGLPKFAPKSTRDVGIIYIKGIFRAPIIRIETENFSTWDELYPMPPGGVVVYANPDGRVAARPLGQPLLEEDSEYTVIGVAYAGFWLPTDKVILRPKENVQSRVDCEEGSVPAPRCWVEVSNFTETIVRVEASEGSLVLFYDASENAKGWGYWKAKGFLILNDSKVNGAPKPWYNVSGFLGDHALVAILHPNYCDVREGNETIRIKTKSNEEINITVKFIEVMAWIEGHFKAEDLCEKGIPKVLKRGFSQLRVGEESITVEPTLSCEVAYVEPSLTDARRAEAEWFNQWARLINASLPPFSNNSGLRICIYGRGIAEAVELNGSIFYSRSLWPRRIVPKAVVLARYYGDLVSPAFIGPVRTGLQPASFNVELPLLSGGRECPPRLGFTAFDRMDESVVAGLLYDSNFEFVLNGSAAALLKSNVADILEHAGQLALLSVSIIAVAYAAVLFAGLVGGFITPALPILKPLHSTFLGLEQLGRSFFSLSKEIFTVKIYKRKLYSPREPSTLTALDLAVEIRRSIEQLKEGLNYRRGGLKGAAVKTIAAWQKYSSMHPIPALLRAASEIALRVAVSRVKLDVPYVEKLRLALRDPTTRKLIVASDVLYAASWLLDSKLGTLGPALRYVKRLMRGYRLVYPKELSEKDLRKIKRPRLELEKTLAAVAHDILKGRDFAKSLSRVKQLAGLYPQLEKKIKHYFGEKDPESVKELACKIISLAAGEGFTSKELFRLLEKFPEAALFVADRAAIGQTGVRGAWREAVAVTLSKLSQERGIGVDLGAVWLSSYERGELWRYLVIRIAWELAEGREPWFTSKLQPEVKRVLVEVSRAIAEGSSSVDLEAAFRDGSIDAQAARFLRGYLTAQKNNKSADLRSAVEAFILSGDPYWAGWAAALAQQQGGSVELASKIVGSQLKWFGPRVEENQLARNVASFLERAYRELANVIIDVEEKLRLLEGYCPLPSSGMSVALTAAEQADLGRLASRLQDLQQCLNMAIVTLNALLAECSELKLVARSKEFYGSGECGDALKHWHKLAVKALGDFYRIREQVEENIRRVRG